MADSTKVLDLLDELEDLVEDSSSVPLSNKVMINRDDIYDIIKDIRLSLPEDIKQAEWIREQKDGILNSAKSEYDRIIKEANEEAAYLVDNAEITLRAKKIAQDTLKEADMNSRILKMKTYDYVDKILYDMQGKMDELNMKYFGEMYTNLEHTFQGLAETLNANREEIKELATKAQQEGMDR